MPKRTENRRTTWTRNAPLRERPDIGRAAGRDDRLYSDRKSNIQRQGPYETSYQISNGYSFTRDIL